MILLPAVLFPRKVVGNVAGEAEQWACKRAKDSSDEYWRTVNYDTLEKCTLT